MSNESSYLNKLIESGAFHFAKLSISEIDNGPIYERSGNHMAREEICLFHRDMDSGDDYTRILDDVLRQSILSKRAMPIVRFADGEYAFYNFDLSCNGLYRQAESVKAIRSIMPVHINALKNLAAQGRFAPLIFPENSGQHQTGMLSLLRRWKKIPSAVTFLDLLFRAGIELTKSNYIPFYAVYAYLTSGDFARLLNDLKICIINPESNQIACASWFEQFSSHPEISFVDIPDAYIATRWPMIKESILEEIPQDTSLCLVGAGIGALLVCVDVAQHLSIPTIDAGHVLNMMNDRVDKSNGMRLYTIRKAAIQD
ncbi:MAG: hypothetical protein ABSB79_02230 [Syntrophales bacterium]|jgi:hypothetical protein